MHICTKCLCSLFALYIREVNTTIYLLCNDHDDFGKSRSFIYPLSSALHLLHPSITTTVIRGSRLRISYNLNPALHRRLISPRGISKITLIVRPGLQPAIFAFETLDALLTASLSSLQANRYTSTSRFLIQISEPKRNATSRSTSNKAVCHHRSIPHQYHHYVPAPIPLLHHQNQPQYLSTAH